MGAGAVAGARDGRGRCLGPARAGVGAGASQRQKGGGGGDAAPARASQAGWPPRDAPCRVLLRSVAGHLSVHVHVIHVVWRRRGSRENQAPRQVRRGSHSCLPALGLGQAGRRSCSAHRVPPWRLPRVASSCRPGSCRLLPARCARPRPAPRDSRLRLPRAARNGAAHTCGKRVRRARVVPVPARVAPVLLPACSSRARACTATSTVSRRLVPWRA